MKSASVSTGLGIALGALLAASALACGPGTKKIGENPSWRSGNSDDARASGSSDHSGAPGSSNQAPGAGDKRQPRIARLAPIVFAPSSQATPSYNDPPVAKATPDALGEMILQAIDDYHASNGGTAPVADGRLFRAASELAGVVREDSPLAYPLVEFAMQRHGIIEPSPHIMVIWGPLDEPGEIVAQLAPRLPEILASGEYARVGIGSSRRQDNGDGAAILAFQASYLTTKPIPRSLPRGGTVKLEGTIHQKYSKPQVFVTHEDGSVTRPKLHTSRSGGFRATVSCKGRRGRQQVEITAIDTSGSNVLANFPVWCNARAPESVTIKPSVDDRARVETEAQAEALMLELVNQDREKHRLPPLAASPEVTEVSRSHSREMRDTGVVAHVSPTTGSAADRIRTAKIRTAVVLENVARAYGVGEAQDGLMNSPGHRANLLSDMVTHVGIGIVFGEEVAGRREMFVTQVFTREPPRISASEARKQLHALLGATRSVALDKDLSGLAQQHADALAAGNGSDQVARQTSKKLDAFASRYRRVTSAVTGLTDVAAFDTAGVLSDKRVTHYGLGVAKGTHPELGDDSFFVVVLLAQAR